MAKCAFRLIGRRAILPLLAVYSCLFGCAPATNQVQPVGAAKPAGVHTTSAMRLTPPPSVSRSQVQSCRVPALLELWRRRAETAAGDFPIGPGDIIDVSVPEIDELQNQKVRVSAEGQIELPLVGTLEAAGLGESELHDALVERLKVYMKKPRVELFVENYRSRGVAIMGAVQKPGYYDMANEQESLQAMIGQAGGFSSSAAQQIIFSPAHPKDLAPGSSKVSGFDLSHGGFAQANQNGADKSIASASDESHSLPLSSTPAPAAADTPAEYSVTLNLDTGGDAGCLSLPARPGDVVIVPVAGQVMVEGWVQNPGAFSITPGMTILGAVTAAGGPVFSWWVELIRANAVGGKTITHYTLSRLESGQEPDPPVQSGDVLLVEKTMVGAVPYAFYSLFEHFGTGIALPLF
jgi:protein involved in polysaccharide export with SLBB domain